MGAGENRGVDGAAAAGNRFGSQEVKDQAAPTVWYRLVTALAVSALVILGFVLLNMVGVAPVGWPWYCATLMALLWVGFFLRIGLASPNLWRLVRRGGFHLLDAWTISSGWRNTCDEIGLYLKNSSPKRGRRKYPKISKIEVMPAGAAVVLTASGSIPPSKIMACHEALAAALGSPVEMEQIAPNRVMLKVLIRDPLDGSRGVRDQVGDDGDI